MNTLKKLAFSILASVFVFANANAGELAVSGSAKVTYTILSVDGSATDDSAGKGLGMANEFSLTAGGELDNGFTWATNIDIDAATVQDDASMVIGMGGLGSVKFNISDGGIQKNFSSSQSVYGTPVDNGEGGTYTDSPDTGAMHSIRYTTPSGLPLGLSASVQYAPYTGTNDANSSNAAGAVDVEDEDAIAYAVDLAPIDGLAIGASYFNPDSPKTAQKTEGGAWYATYDVGMVSLGYGESYFADGHDTNTTNEVDNYQNRQMSIAFNVNDSLSLSYETIDSEKNYETSSSDVEMSVDSIQAAYTVAGMTLSLSNEEYDNHDYTSGNKMKETNFALSIAF